MLTIIINYGKYERDVQQSGHPMVLYIYMATYYMVSDYIAHASWMAQILARSKLAKELSETAFSSLSVG